MNDKLACLLGPDLINGIKKLKIKDKDEDNPKELFHFQLKNQSDKKGSMVIDNIEMKNKPRKGEQVMYQGREYFKSVIGLEDDTNFHLFDRGISNSNNPTHVKITQRYAEIKVQKSNQSSFSHTDTFSNKLDVYANKLQENIPESQVEEVEEEINIKNKNLESF